MPYRQDRVGQHRTQLDKNKKIILTTRSVCAICGQEVDRTLKWPHPMSASIDHIIPISKGGHPSSMDNLQLAHFICNRLKSDKLNVESKPKAELVGLPQTINWINYVAK